MNCCQQNILHINLHILYIIHIKTSLKIQELQESNKYFNSYLTEFHQPLQVQSHLEMPRILVQLGHIQHT